MAGEQGVESVGHVVGFVVEAEVVKSLVGSADAWISEEWRREIGCVVGRERIVGPRGVVFRILACSVLGPRLEGLFR